jgi:hypothetical protein
MEADSGSDQDDEERLLRPAWEDTADETDADRGVRPSPGRTRLLGWTAETENLLGPLCAATDALARLDARAVATNEVLREGLLARMAYTEAAGFLAHAHAWAHPLDLALRDLGLTASTALAAAGAPYRALPQTFAATANTTAWANPPLDTLPAGDAAIAEALALTRALRRLTDRTGTSTSAQAVATAQTLHTLGAGSLDPAGFAAWWDAAVVAPANDRRRRNRRGGEPAPPALPPLLAAAGAAQAWMEAGLTDTPAPGQALLLAAASLAGARTLSASFLPVWAAYPALGFGDRDALPSLRSDAADRLVGWGERVSWECAFFHLVTDSARMGLQTLERLQTMTEKARGLAVGLDKRARLPDAVDALLRTPVLTPSALAARLRVVPQTATAVLRTLQDAGVVREVTGRGRFRAFAM